MKSAVIATLAVAGVLLGIPQVLSMNNNPASKPQAIPGTKTAVFAGGCFWCTEADFEKAHGVIEVISGYSGGKVKNPSYQQVSSGRTSYVESVKVIYDPKKTTYGKLLDYFWRHVDPTDAHGSFVDRGRQYRSVIFYSGDKERKAAEASKAKLAASGVFDKPIVTEILPLEHFYEAEAYHQDFYKRNKTRYNRYRSGSGRDQFLEKTWANQKTSRNQRPPDTMTAKSSTNYSVPNDQELRRRLTPLQYSVVRNNGTERPFKNTYWDNKKPGIYVDIVSGEPLFSSTDKFESGTGWPSFTKPLVPANIVEKEDRSLFATRTEVRSKYADSHLGHVFKDGPKPSGLRYCINSAALRFVPKEELKQQGYAQFASLFD